MTPFEMGRRDSARIRLAAGLPAKVGPENPDELARVVALVREGAENMRERERTAESPPHGAGGVRV